MIQALDNRFRSWGERRTSLRELLNRAAAGAGADEVEVGLDMLRAEASSVERGEVPYVEMIANDPDLFERVLGMPRPFYLVVVVHYVTTENTRRRQKLAGTLLDEGKAIRDRRYWDLLDRAHWWLAGRAYGTDLMREPWHSSTVGPTAGSEARAEVESGRLP